MIYEVEIEAYDADGVSKGKTVRLFKGVNYPSHVMGNMMDLINYHYERIKFE